MQASFLILEHVLNVASSSPKARLCMLGWKYYDKIANFLVLAHFLRTDRNIGKSHFANQSLTSNPVYWRSNLIRADITLILPFFSWTPNMLWNIVCYVKNPLVLYFMCHNYSTKHHGETQRLYLYYLKLTIAVCIVIWLWIIQRKTRNYFALQSEAGNIGYELGCIYTKYNVYKDTF